MRVFVVSLLCLWLAGCGIIFKKQTALELWLESQALECRAMKGRIHWDAAALTVRCYRTPMFRQPKLKFERVFEGTT